MRRGISFLIGLIVLITVPTGCGGGGAKNFNITRTTTTGKELMDLKLAREQGALSEDEYQEQREKVLRGAAE